MVALFAEKVQFVMVEEELSLTIPPPASALLVEKVHPVIVGEDSMLFIPPPAMVALFPFNVQLEMVGEELL